MKSLSLTIALLLLSIADTSWAKNAETAYECTVKAWELPGRKLIDGLEKPFIVDSTIQGILHVDLGVGSTADLGLSLYDGSLDVNLFKITPGGINLPIQNIRTTAGSKDLNILVREFQNRAIMVNCTAK